MHPLNGLSLKSKFVMLLVVSISLAADEKCQTLHSERSAAFFPKLKYTNVSVSRDTVKAQWREHSPHVNVTQV